MKLPSIFKTDFHPALLLVLALLAIPRVVLHDLRLVSFDSFIYQSLATGPFLFWAGIALFRKTTRPFFDYLVLGVTFGLFLAATHQILWDASWGDEVPRIKGNLEGQLTPILESTILRIAAILSSIITGTVVGAALGLVGLASSKARTLFAKPK